MTARTMCRCSSRDFTGNAHCTGCCRSFTTESAFHKHLRIVAGQVAEHVDPDTAGLVQRADGRWGWPPPDNAPWRITR